MENLNIILFISIMIPLSMILFIFKGKTRQVVSFLILGIVISLLASEVNGLVISTFHLDAYYATINITPVIEEILKASPILVFTFLYKPSRRELMECALVVGIGFALLENTYALASSYTEHLSFVFALMRGFGSGMMHGICTLAIGYGMSFVSQDKRLAYAGTFSLLTVAIIYHSTYNCLIQSKYADYGIILPILTFIPLVIYLRKNNID